MFSNKNSKKSGAVTEPDAVSEETKKESTAEAQEVLSPPTTEEAPKTLSSAEQPDASEQEDASEKSGSEETDSDSQSSEQQTAAVSTKSDSSVPEKEELSTNDEQDDEEEDLSQESDVHDGGFEHDDPLAPAYDLDRGGLLDKHQGTELPWHTDVKTAKEFFNTELLYRFDILEPEDAGKIAGRYRIELKGYQGGVWTLVLGNDIEIVNRKEDADLVLTMQQRDFLELVNGRLNPQLALLGQKMKVQGDVRKAISFQRILVPSPE